MWKRLAVLVLALAVVLSGLKWKAAKDHRALYESCLKLQMSLDASTGNYRTADAIRRWCKEH